MNKRLLVSALLSAPSLLLFAPLAHAQQTRHLDIEVAGRVSHDTNVPRASKAVERAAGIDPSDTVFNASISADILVPISRQAFYLRGQVGLDRYSKADFYNTSYFDVDGGFNLHGGPCDGALDQTFRRSRTAAQSIALISKRNVETVEATTFHATCGQRVGFAPDFSVSHATGDNSEVLVKPSNFETWSYSYGIAYRRPGFGQVTVYGSHDKTENKDRLVLIGGVLTHDGYTANSGGVRYERRLGARLSGDVEAGYTRLNSDLPTVNDFHGVTYGAHLEFRPQSRLDTRLTLERAAKPTTQIGAAYSVVTTEQFDTSYELGRRLTVNGGISHVTDHYRGAALTGALVSDETLTSYFAGARLGIGRRIFLTADTRWQKRNTNIAGLDYSENLTSVGVAAKF